MIYLYGLSDLRPADRNLAALHGVTGAVDASETACDWLIHGPSDGTELLPKRRHLLAHTKVLEELGAQATVLPMRFGMMAQSVDEFAGLVDRNATDIAESFKRLSGKVELGLRIDFPRDAALSAALAEDPALAKAHARLSGLATAPHFQAAEFGRRLAEALDARRGQAQRILLEQLRPHITDFRVKTPESDVQALALDVLIPESAQQGFAAETARAADAAADFAGGAEAAIRIVGPVPAFSFVDLTLSTAEAA